MFHMGRRYKQIPLKPDTWRRLHGRKAPGESWDDLLNRLSEAAPEAAPEEAVEA